MPAIPIDRLQATLRLMNEALPTAMVSGYEKHIPMDITVWLQVRVLPGPPIESVVC
jgi:hypothetical protein